MSGNTKYFGETSESLTLLFSSSDGHFLVYFFRIHSASLTALSMIFWTLSGSSSFLKHYIPENSVIFQRNEIEIYVPIGLNNSFKVLPEPKL